MTAPPMTEKAFQSMVVKTAKECGWRRIYHAYNSERSDKGFPDLVMVHPHQRRIIFAELKREGEYPTPEQYEWLRDLLECTGVETYVWRPSDWETITQRLQGRQYCPDNGRCHHGCNVGYCWRVKYAAPLSDTGWETWPQEIIDANGAKQ